ncbi:hypothetical protein [Dokdonella sp.]|uniref:hypothetical protein n=1 Tax=Dokdonella sp. TaxID=2291710 RepID=UPI002F41CE4D
MHSLGTNLLFMHGHIVDVELARRLADAAASPPWPSPDRSPRRAPLRRLAALLGWLGHGAVRAWPN